MVKWAGMKLLAGWFGSSARAERLDMKTQSVASIKLFGSRAIVFRGRLQWQQTATSRNRDCVGPIVSAQFVDYVFDVKVDGVFGN